PFFISFLASSFFVSWAQALPAANDMQQAKTIATSLVMIDSSLVEANEPRDTARIKKSQPRGAGSLFSLRDYFFVSPFFPARLFQPASSPPPGPPGVATGSRLGFFSLFFLSPLPGPFAPESASLPGPPGVATASRFGVFSDFFLSPLPGPEAPASASVPGPPGVATELFFFGSSFFASWAYAPLSASDKQLANTTPISFFICLLL